MPLELPTAEKSIHERAYQAVPYISILIISALAWAAFAFHAHAAGVYAFDPDLSNNGCIDEADVDVFGQNLHIANPQLGDLNRDGKVNAKDAAYIMKTWDGCLPGWSPSAPAGDKMYKVESNGIVRTYIVHVPTAYTGQPLPLVLNFHGGSGQSNGQQIISRMNASANLNSYFAVYPNGSSLSTHPLDTTFFWNPGLGEQGYLKPFSGLKNVDDVQFIDDLLDKVENDYRINTRKVYATGLSNGGMMAQQLACHLANRITAIASSEGTLWEFTNGCQPSRPVPTLLFNGTGDNWLPYNGGAPMCVNISEKNWKSANEVFDAWQQKNSCSTASATTQISADTSCKTYSQCAGGAEVSLCTISNGGHTWPGGTTYIAPYPDPSCDIGNISVTNGSQVMWNFFSQFTLP